MDRYQPPFHLTERILNQVAAISEEIGKIKVLSHGALNPRLRKENRIRTIQSSLAIENNSLSLEQVTAIVNGQRILGNPNEIREVKNAYQAYDLMLSLNPYSMDDLLKAHRIMMEGLIRENGKFRSGGVGVVKGDMVVHMAPPAEFVPGEIQDLLHWYPSSEMHPLVKSAIFHYEFEFIHPFADGNGRIGRMWHSLLLGKWNELFYWLPIEELIRSRQAEYYQALSQSDKESDSAPFVALMLDIIQNTLKETTAVGYLENSNAPKRQNIGVFDGVLEEKILTAIMNKPSITQTDLSKQLGIPYRTLQRKMEELQNAKKIARVGGKRFGHWAVKK